MNQNPFSNNHNVRDTSLEVLKIITENGYLGESRTAVYTALFNHGPATANELAKKAFRHLEGTNQQMNLSARLNELREMGCITETGKRPCSITGNQVIEWDITGKLPVKLPRCETNKQKITRLITLLNWIIKNNPGLAGDIMAKSRELKGNK